MNNKIMFGSGLSSYKDMEGIRNVCKIALKNGITSFDTAPSYRTEVAISEAVRISAMELGMNREDYSIQTKIDPIQMYNGNIEGYFKEKLKEMHLDYIDSLLIHWPIKKYFHDTLNTIIKLKQQGVAKSIGICNLRIRHLKDLHNEGIIFDILQIERHPLNTFREEAEWCVKNGIFLQDYSPLCKMHPFIKNNEDIKSIAQKYGKNEGQIILRWHIDTGATPIFTSKNVERVKQYSELWDFKLSQDEIEKIYSLNCNHKLYLESLICPGF